MYVHRSNRLEPLVSRLADVCATPGLAPMEPEVVIVQNKGMGRWLGMELSRKLGVFANAQFPTPRKFLEEAFAVILDDSVATAEVTSSYSPDRMVWSIATLLPELEGDPAFAELRGYLANDRHGVRRIELATRLAEVFDNYPVYRPETVLGWEEGIPGEWQAMLWRALVARNEGAPTHLARRARDAIRACEKLVSKPSKLPKRVSIFGIDSLPPLFVEVFAALSRQVEVHLFLISPSRAYWGEISAPRDLARARLADTTDDDDELARTLGNPLLASFGRVGRDFQHVLEGRVDYQEDARDLHVEPAQLTILHGFSVAKPPLSQSVGIMLADNTVSWYLRKSAVLPARNTMTHATTVALARGQTGEAIHVPLVQGESSRADRNKVIGILRIVAEKLGRDLPVGSEVQVTMSVDESSRTTGRAYVPLLDQWFDEIVLFRMETKDAGQVGKGLSTQKDRLAELESMADKLEGEPAKGDARVREIEALIEEGDRDALDLADQMVRWMSDELDRAEDEGAAGTLRTEFAEHTTLLNDLLTKDDVGERRQIKALSVEFERAMARSDFETAKAKVDQARQLATRVLRRHPGYWRSVFKWVCERIDAHGLRAKGAQLIAKGERHVALIAANQNADSQIAPLSEVCSELARMLPADEQDKGASSRVISHVK